MGNGRTIDFARSAKGMALVLSLLASAYVTAFAIGSTGHPWLGWIILPPLFVAIRFLAPRLAMACGAIWGLSVFLFSVCVVETAVPATGLSIALLTLVPAMYAYLCARVTCGLGFCALLLGFGWIGVELGLRPLGLHHGLLAGTQGGGVLLAWAGNLFGYVFVAFIIAFANGLLLSVFDVVSLRKPSWFVAVSIDNGGGEWLRCSSRRLLSTLVQTLSRPRAPPVVA